ncbi:DUF1534 domain-containing protein [Pseudomonas cannabina]|nr:DUF1534 domain-containing protein [Pseudomonas cannabina]
MKQVKIGRRASRTACDAERRTIGLSFPTLQRRNAFRDAPHRMLKIRRGASHDRLSFRTLQRRNAFRDALRHTAVLRGQLDMLSTQGTFSPLGE